MAYNIVFVVPNEESRQLTLEVLEEQVAAGGLRVEVVRTDGIVAQGEALVEQGADAIVARGGTYRTLAGAIGEIPVLHLRATSSDVLLTLSEVSRLGKRIHLILHRLIPFDYEECREILNIDCVFCRYTSLRELKETLARVPVDEDSVVVGTGLDMENLEIHGLHVVPIPMRPATIAETYAMAVRTLENMEGERAKTRLLETVLATIEDGILVADGEGVVYHCNPMAQTLLGRGEEEMVGRCARALLPDLPRDAPRSKDHLVRTMQRNLAVRADPFTVAKGRTHALITLKDVSRLQELEKDVRAKLAKRGFAADHSFESILTADGGMQRLVERARRVAALDEAVLLYGESGTGKELFAQSIHNSSRQRGGPFVAVNCAALSESLLESELFGYVGGAFTGARREGKAGLFEMAHGGTIFLDEINSMSLNLQSKILRALEQREIMRVGSDYIIPLNVRVIAASNRPLAEQVDRGSFRSDLYYRLNMIELRIPPLRERRGDIPYLFCHFLAGYRSCPPREVELPARVLARLEAHPWPGNIRELRSTALRYHLFGEGEDGEEVLPGVPLPGPPGREVPPLDLRGLNRVVEQSVIAYLGDAGLSKAEIARRMGISRQALYNKLKQGRAEE